MSQDSAAFNVAYAELRAAELAYAAAESRLIEARYRYRDERDKYSSRRMAAFATASTR